MSTPERQRKVEKIIEKLMEKLSNEPEFFDERFTGSLTIHFNLSQGAVAGSIESTRKGHIATA